MRLIRRAGGSPASASYFPCSPDDMPAPAGRRQTTSLGPGRFVRCRLFCLAPEIKVRNQSEPKREELIGHSRYDQRRYLAEVSLLAGFIGKQNPEEDYSLAGPILPDLVTDTPHGRR